MFLEELAGVVPEAGVQRRHLAGVDVISAQLEDSRVPARALRLFKSNTLSGLVLFAGLALGAWRG